MVLKNAHMTWSPENDRILLLKLVETHAITVDPKRIAAAWPRDAPVKPTPRAITERFVKLRNLVGIKTTISSTGKPPARPVKYTDPDVATPSSSAKKRKATRKDDSDESDAEDHLTEDESPTKRKATSARVSASRPKMRGGASNSDEDLDHGFLPATPSRVKKEPIQSLAQSPQFQADAKLARDINNALNGPHRNKNIGGTTFTASPGHSFDASLGFGQLTMPTPNNSRTNSFGAGSPGLDGIRDQGMFAAIGNHQGFVDMNGLNTNVFNSSPMNASSMNLNNMGMNAMGMNEQMNFNLGHLNDLSNHHLGHGGVGLHMDVNQHFANGTLPPNFNGTQAFAMPGHQVTMPQAFEMQPSPDTSIAGVAAALDLESPLAHRAPSARNASKAANENMSAFIQVQKEQDREAGEKSSEEDSQGSEFINEEYDEDFA